MITWAASLIEQLTPMLVPWEHGDAITILTHLIDLLARVYSSPGDDEVIDLRALLYNLGR